MTVTLENGWWCVDGRIVIADMAADVRDDVLERHEAATIQRMKDIRAIRRHINLLVDPLVLATAKACHAARSGYDASPDAMTREWERMADDYKLNYYKMARIIIAAQEAAK